MPAPAHSDLNFEYYLHIRLLNLWHVRNVVSLGRVTVTEDDYDRLLIDVAGIKRGDGMPVDVVCAQVDACAAWLDGTSPEGNPFSDKAMREGADYWSGWFFSPDYRLFYQRVFTGNEIAYPYCRNVRGQWEWEWNADRPFDDQSDAIELGCEENYEPRKWALVDDSILIALLDRMEASVNEFLLDRSRRRLFPDCSTPLFPVDECRRMVSLSY